MQIRTRPLEQRDLDEAGMSAAVLELSSGLIVI